MLVPAAAGRAGASRLLTDVESTNTLAGGANGKADGREAWSAPRDFDLPKKPPANGFRLLALNKYARTNDLRPPISAQIVPRLRGPRTVSDDVPDARTETG